MNLETWLLTEQERTDMWRRSKVPYSISEAICRAQQRKTLEGMLSLIDEELGEGMNEAYVAVKRLRNDAEKWLAENPRDSRQGL